MYPSSYAVVKLTDDRDNWRRDSEPDKYLPEERVLYGVAGFLQSIEHILIINQSNYSTVK